MEKEQDLDEILRKAVLGWRILTKTENDVEVQKRLIQHESAREAWRKLRLKVSAGDFNGLVSTIVLASIGANLGRSELKTMSEIQEASQKASALAERLIRLIESNATLQSFFGEDIRTLRESAALSRLSGALMAAKTEKGGNTGRWFSQDIEDELDEVQSSRYPEFPNLTTSKAWSIVHVDSVYKAPKNFVDHLRNFSEFAQRSRLLNPVVPNPNSKNAAMQVFGLRVCNILNSSCGSPNLHITAGLVSAVRIPVNVTDHSGRT